MKLAIGNDHTSIQLKASVLEHLKGRPDIIVTDLGAMEAPDPEGRDYPDYALRIGQEVAAGTYDMGILLCGTGVGMCIAANKVSGIRAVVCSEPYSARLSREHNDANILCIGARVVGDELAKMILDAFLDAQHMGGRHALRVEKIMAIEGR